MRPSSFACCLIVLLMSVASAFVSHREGIATGPSCPALGAKSSSTSCERSAFIKTAFASIATITTFVPDKSFAAESLDDLSMPSEGEQKTADVS